MSTVELDRFHLRAAEQVQGQARGGGPCIQGKDPAAASQPEQPLRILGQSLTIQGARGLRLSDGCKALAIEKGRAGRGDGPDAVAAVLITEPNRIGGQALGGGERLKGPAAVAQQAGGGADP